MARLHFEERNCLPRMISIVLGVKTVRPTTMLLLQAWAVAPYVAQVAIDRLSLILNEPPILGVLRRAIVQVCGCG
jgi:hypothetical protein